MSNPEAHRPVSRRSGRASGAALAVFAAVATACGGRQAAAPVAAGSRPAVEAVQVPEVAVAQPTTEIIRTDVEAPGTFIPFEEATIGAEAAGPIAELRVEESSRVARGQVLVRLDPVKAELTVKQAEAQLAQARANFAKAHSEIGRKQQLLDDRTIAPGAFDTYRAQHDAAAAGVTAAESGLELARQRLGDLTVTAPFAGVVREKRAAIGEYVREGDDLVVLMRIDPIKLQFDLPEQYAGRIGEGQDVRARLTALAGQDVTGRITKILPAIAVQSRTVRVEAQVANPGHRLRPGFSATVVVPIASAPGSLVVPLSAVVRHEGRDSVFVVRGDRVDLVAVRTGASTADRVEIVSGLAKDATVVVSGGEALRHGDRVKRRG